MMAAAPAGPRRRVGAYLVLVFALALPFWMLGALSDLEILPALPVSALMAVVPAVAAFALVWGAGGGAALKAFAAKAFDWQRAGWPWLLANFAFMPAALLAAFLLMRTMGAEMPEPHIALALLVPMFFAFFLAGLAEEYGWTAYALPPLEARFGWLGAGIVIGLVWAAWHAVPFLQTGRALDWVLWHSAATLALRIVMTGFYVRSGRSLFSAALFHAMSNVAYFSFPNLGSHYDPRYFLPTLLISVLVLMALLSSHQMLARE